MFRRRRDARFASSCSQSGDDVERALHVRSRVVVRLVHHLGCLCGSEGANQEQPRSGQALEVTAGTPHDRGEDQSDEECACPIDRADHGRQRR